MPEARRIAPLEVPYAPRATRPRGIWDVVIIATIVTITVLFVCPFLTTTRPYRHPPRARCVANLLNIGKALTMYANDHKGSFPPDLQTLVNEDYLESEELVCPSSGTANYIYIPRLDWDDPPVKVLVYEPPANHDSAFANVLFVDLHVATTTPTELESILAAEHNLAGRTDTRPAGPNTQRGSTYNLER